MAELSGSMGSSNMSSPVIGSSSTGIGAAVSIGNYKGVMLCNRPFNGVSSTLAKTTVAASGARAAFLAGIPNERIGQNVPIHSEPMHAIKRDKKHTALSKHKKWLHDLQKERSRLEKMLLEDEEAKRKRKERFTEKEAKFRQAVRGSESDAEGDSQQQDPASSSTKPELDEEMGASDALPRRASGKAPLNRPMWALTKETADEKLEFLQDKEANELLDFAKNLDLDKFLDEVEIKAKVAQVEQQLAQVQSIVEQEEAEEKRLEREENKLIEDGNNSEDPATTTAPLNANDLSKLDRMYDAEVKHQHNDQDDDRKSIASTVFSECKSIRAVHSIRSVAALTKRAAAKMETDSIASTPPHPRVVTVEEDKGVRLQIKLLPSNLPYIHRNPAI